MIGVLSARAAEPVRLYNDVAVSPDGTRIATIEEVLDGTELDAERLRTNLIVCDINGQSAAVVESVPGCLGELSDVAWSPDGRLLTYVRMRVDTLSGGDREYRVRVLNADGSRGKTVVRSAGILSGPDFTHDGMSLVYTRWGEGGVRTLHAVGLDGQNDKEIVRGEVDPGRARRADRGGYFLFNSKSVNADGTLNAAETRRVVCAVKPDGTGLVQAMAWPGTNTISLINFSLSRDSSRLIVEGVSGFITGQAWQVMGIGEGTGEFQSPPVRGAFCILPDGSGAVFCGGQERLDHLYIVPFKGNALPLELGRVSIDEVPAPFDESDGMWAEADQGGPAPADAESRRFGGVTISPDGSQIVFAWEVTEGEAAGTSELWTMRADGSRLHRVTEGETDSEPRYVSGTQVVFARAVKGEHGTQHDIYSINPWNGIAQAVVVTDADETQPEESPDGEFIFRRSPMGTPAEGTIVRLKDNVETTLVGTEYDPTHPVYAAAVGVTMFSSKPIDENGKVFEGNRHLGVVMSVNGPVKSWRNSNGSPADLLGCRVSRDGARILTEMRAEGVTHLYFEESSLLGTASGEMGKVRSFRSYDLAQDGSRLVFVGTADTDAPGAAEGIFVVDWNSGVFTRLTPGTASAGVVLESESSAWVEEGQQDPLEEPTSAEQVSDVATRVELSWPTLSPDGRRIAVVESEYEGSTDVPHRTALVTADLDGTGVAEVAVMTGLRRPRWNSSGTQVIFEASVDMEDDREVFVCNANGSGRVRVTTNDVDDVEPVFSGDDTGVIFVRVRADGSRELISAGPSGQNEEVLLGSDFEPGCPVAWPGKARFIVARSRPVDAQGALVQGAKGWMMTSITDKGLTPVLHRHDEDQATWPMAMRLVKGKFQYVAWMAAEPGSERGLATFVDEDVSNKESTDVPGCVVAGEEMDLSADGSLFVFRGYRTWTDGDERPGIWVMGVDGKKARLFTLKR